MLLVKVNSTQKYITAISGLFINKDNPTGLTPKEIQILAIVVFIMETMRKVEIDKDVKTEVASVTGHSIQVVTNYINRFRKKRVLSENRLHALLTAKGITVKYEEERSL